MLFVITSARIGKILVEGGRAVGAITERGIVYRARRAVVSTLHFTDLPKMIDAPLPAPFVEGTETWRAGPSLFVVHIATPANVTFRTRDGAIGSVLSGQSTLAGLKDMHAAVSAGRLPSHEPWMLVGCSTWVDPSRAPAGQGNIKIASHAPFALDGDARNWDKVKQEYGDFLVAEFARLTGNFKPSDALGICYHSPLDISRINAGFYRGGPQGGDLFPDQMGENRPVRGWARYRMPIDGLYQPGGSTHPGGLVSGWPGRHCARAVLEDLQIDPAKVMPGHSGPPKIAVPMMDTSKL